jgi:hypothetical protein
MSNDKVREELNQSLAYISERHLQSDGRNCFCDVTPNTNND